MSELVETARRYVVSLMEDLTGENDFMPFMTIRTHDGRTAFAALEIPAGSNERDSLGDVMMALCAIHRATEVVFVSTSWMVTKQDLNDEDDLTNPLQGVAPSRHPDRVEAVTMMSISGDRCEGTSHFAPVIRENNTVSLGEWTDRSGVGFAGRFGDALIAGMQFGRKFPPDMCEYVDAEIAANREQELIQSMLRALSSARTGAFKN